MSRQPSPGPSQPNAPSQVFQTAPPPTIKQKSKTFTPGIAAGAEDVKYQNKYKELKRKVKEIEADNDKLQFKVLQAKKSINRMKIERAVLYDRLSQVPPSPELNDRQPLPPAHPGSGASSHQLPQLSGPGNHQHRDVREHVPVDHNDRSHMEYMHTHPNVRMGVGPDGRPVPVQEIPMGPGVAPSSHTLSSVHSSRHGPPVHESSRQLPPLSHMAPVQHLEPPRSHSHSHSHSPHMSTHASSSRPHSHSHSRSHSSSSRSRTHQPSIPYPQHTHQQASEGQSPIQHMSSPSISGERERLRRHEGHERVSHPEHHSHSRHQAPLPPNPVHSSPGTRTSSRSHHQQRPDRLPVNHSELEREREMDIEREWEYERQIAMEREMVAHSHRPPTPPFSHRSSRQPLERPGDYHEPPSYRLREDTTYHRDIAGPGGHTRLSRSGTPGSGSGSGPGEGPPRPDSRTQYYDRDITRSYASRPPPHDDDYVREERGSHSRDRDRNGGAFVSSDRAYPESRKRNHYEMEMDGEAEVPSVTGSSASRKRIHQDNTPVRDADSQEEDDDMDA